jgi:hypothetical protein
VAEETVYLLFCNMLLVNEENVGVFFGPVDVAKETPFPWNLSPAGIDCDVTTRAVIRFPAGSQVSNQHAFIPDSLLRCIVTYEALPVIHGAFFPVQVAEETDVQGNLHMFSLDNVGMTAPAMESDSARMLGKMGLVVKDNGPFRPEGPVLVAFQAGDVVVCGTLPLIEKRRHEMAVFADRRVRDHYFPHKQISNGGKGQDHTDDYGSNLHHHPLSLHYTKSCGFISQLINTLSTGNILPNQDVIFFPFLA